MTEPQTIPLWGFDAAQERAFHHIRMKRLGDDAFTGRERLGMRLSIDDPVRRVKAFFEPFWRVHIDEGTSARGYMMEDLVEVAVMRNPESVYRGARYDSQVQIPWGPTDAASVSAFDFVTKDPAIPISVKSVDTGKPVDKLKPSTANIRQEVRMLVEAGYRAGTEWHTWMGSLGQMRVRGPFVHVLTQEAMDAYLVEREAVDRAWRYFASVKDPLRDPSWNDPDAWVSMLGLVSTSGAFRFASLDANGAIERRHRRAMQLKAEAKAAQVEAEAARELIHQHVREQIDLARQTDPSVKSVRAYAGEKVATYTLRKDGAIVVTEKPFIEDAGAAA